MRAESLDWPLIEERQACPPEAHLVPAETKGGKLFLAHLPSLRVGFLIKPAVHFKPFIRARRADQVDHYLIRGQRHAAPIARDMAEQPMLDFIPFAGPRRIMADLDNHPRGIGQALQLMLPQPIAMAITSPTVRGDQQPRRRGVALAAQLFPPLRN